MAEFRRDYHIPDDVHLSLAELDTTPWEKSGFTNKSLPYLAFHQFLPYNKWHRRAKSPAWPQPRFSRAISPKIIKNTSDKDVNDDDFFWVSGNFEDQETQIPGDRINWNKRVADLNHLKSLYNYPNLDALRAAEVPQVDQTNKAVVAFPTSQPSSSRPTTSFKWVPKITYKNRTITNFDSVVAEKDHLLAFNLAKSICLPTDMEHHDHLTELKAIRSTTKSMVLALQKNHVAHKRMLELRKTTR
ncbi:hypothetical protein CsSME_00028732 [Camellia sinensis var. sinensis]